MKGFFSSVQSLSLIVCLMAGTAAFAQDRAPDCPAFGWPNHVQNLPINNPQVLHWERTTANQYQDRGHVSGPITEIFPDKNGHHHFSIQVGTNATDLIEVIYNEDFGALPDLQVGMTVEACGDYITSTAQSGPYPPSPDGAIIHWVHANPSGKGHPPGYLIVNGVLCGQDTAHAGPHHVNNQ